MDLPKNIVEDGNQDFSGAVLQSAALYGCLLWAVIFPVCFLVKNIVF